MIAARFIARGGKSELHRAERRVTPGGGDPKESAAENIPPSFRLLAGLKVRVKR